MAGMAAAAVTPVGVAVVIAGSRLGVGVARNAKERLDGDIVEDNSVGVIDVSIDVTYRR
jgi:hypothetical protein